MCHHRGICQDKTLPQAPVCRHRGICQDQNLSTSTRVPSPRHLPRQKPYHKHLCAITTAFAKTKTLPQAPVCHHRVIGQDKNLTTSTRVPSPRRWPRQKPYHKHLCAITPAFAKTKTLPLAPACHHRGICQDKKPYHKHPRAITAAFAKTKTLPQAPVCHHRGICQDKNLTTSTGVPSPRHLPRQKPYH